MCECGKQSAASYSIETWDWGRSTQVRKVSKNVHWHDDKKLKKNANKASISNLVRLEKAVVKNKWKAVAKSQERKIFMTFLYTFDTYEFVLQNRDKKYLFMNV